MGWHGEGWATDPAALDAVLQAGLLWCEKVLGGGSLPTSIGRVHLYRTPGPDDLRLVLRKRQVSRDRAVYDAWLVDDQGAVVVALSEVSHHRLPGSGPAARDAAQA